MMDRRGASSTERALKRKRELEDRAAAGDAWAKTRLRINEDVRLRKQSIQDLAAGGNLEAQQKLRNDEKKAKEYKHAWRRKRREEAQADGSRGATPRDIVNEPVTRDAAFLQKGTKSSTDKHDGSTSDAGLLDGVEPQSSSHSALIDGANHRDETGPTQVRQVTHDTSANADKSVKPDFEGNQVMAVRIKEEYQGDEIDQMRTVEEAPIPSPQPTAITPVCGAETSALEEELRLKLRRTRLEREEMEIELKLLELRRKATG